MCQPREVVQGTDKNQPGEDIQPAPHLHEPHVEVLPVPPPPQPEPVQNQNRRKVDKAHNYMGFWWTSCVTVLVTAIIVAWIPSLLSPEPPKGNIQGDVAPHFRKVKEILRLHLLSSEEKGAAFAVYHRGVSVVDIWGGYADIEAWQPWENSTLSNTFSLYCSVISLSLALLSNRGHIDYDSKVSRYWPEFGSRGKDSITVRQLLTDQAALHMLNGSLSLYETQQWRDISDLLANQALKSPGWLYTFGDSSVLELYADQLVRRTDPRHRSMKEFFEQEFIQPLQIDFHIGLPHSEQHRAARTKGHSLGVLFDGFFAPLELGHTLVSYIKSSSAYREINAITRLNDPEIRSSGVGSLSAFASARSFAQLYSYAVLTPPRDQSLLIPRHTWEDMSQASPLRTPYLLTQLGFYANHSISTAGQIRLSPKGTKMVGFSGIGGQYIFVDVENELAMCYMTNYNSIYKSGLDPRFQSLLKALYDSL